MIALGIDPGLAVTGFAVVEALPEGNQAHDWGCIKTARELPNPKRLGLIYQQVCKLITQWSPGLIVIEEAFVDPKYPRAALQLGEVRGSVSVAAHNMEVEVLEIKPSEVKRALTGKGLAPKEEVQLAVSRVLRLADQPTSHHATDAMALALTGLSRKGLLYHL
ncbi:MAG TPA: crossover junction endodeoxyribonuclease RuvC [Candidatus Hypogeohydataceae bacterium YC41]